jgi:hypothetical protein
VSNQAGATPDIAAADTTASEIAALRASLGRLRQEVAALAAASTSPRAIGDLQRKLANPEAYDPPAETVADRLRQETMAAREKSFWQEPIGSRWSSEASSAVMDVLDSKDGDRLEVLSLECRTRICRVELVADEAGDAATMLPMFLLRVDPTLPSATTNQVEYPDGRRGVVVYLTQSDETAPSK